MYVNPFFKQAQKEVEATFNQSLPKPFRVVVALKLVEIQGCQMPVFTPFAYCTN
jgi:hypothetical protein